MLKTRRCPYVAWRPACTRKPSTVSICTCWSAAMTVITGAAEILMEQGGDAPLVRSASERIYRAAHEASDSVTVLLRLARAGIAGVRVPPRGGTGSPGMPALSIIYGRQTAYPCVCGWRGLSGQRPA